MIKKALKWFNDKLDDIVSKMNNEGAIIASTVMTRFSTILPGELNTIMELMPKKKEEKVGLIDVSVVVCYAKGVNLILAVHRKGDVAAWGLPGGKSDEGETCVNAAIRELEEETPYYLTDTDAITYLNTRYIDNYCVHVYIVDAWSIYCHNKECEKNYAWINPQLLLTGAFPEFNKKLLTDLEII